MCRQAILSTLLSACAFGQGGPPFLTDDPGTPGNKNWEINIGLIGNRNPSEGAHSVPEFDINYGLGDRARLTHRVPLTVHESRAPEESVAGGLGNSLLGMKYRFYEHEDRSKRDEAEPAFSLSVHPQLVLNHPTRSVARDALLVLRRAAASRNGSRMSAWSF